MRTHGQLSWTNSIRDLGPRGNALLSLESSASPPGRFPCSTQSLSSREEALFLLHIAAEIEHSLMVEYLYALYSLPKAQTDWVQSLRTISKQEMGHLITVQNLTLALGGPITFEREDYPSWSAFYPFPFTLERPTRDVFAKYVVAEMPPLDSITDPATKHTVQQAMIRSEIVSGGAAVNRVGALYAKLQEVVANVPDDEFCFGTVDTYQASPTEIPQTSGPGVADPMDSIMCWPIDSKVTALGALALIATQGEGPTHAIDTSHFEQFLAIYRAYPETNPLFGVVKPNPALPVPTNPRFSAEGAFDPDNITDPLALPLAQFGNLRYRLVLDGLSHYLLLNRQDRPRCKAYLPTFVTYEMKNTVASVAMLLTSLGRQIPNIFVDGIPAVAGMPFHMPYTLSLSPDEPSRWQSHIGLLEYSGALATELSNDNSCPKLVRTVLRDIVSQDQTSLKEMSGAVANADCS
jgi:hypothetical protein